jgi:predicted nucleic acid-binding Zn ribbon protein
MVSLRTLQHYTINRGIVCIRCLKVRQLEHRPDYWVDKWGDPYAVQRSCESCSRPIFKGGRGWHFFCCEQCEVTYYNHQRRRPKEQKRCEVCSDTFTATRSDQKTCSGACRQKAYRRRKKASTNA